MSDSSLAPLEGSIKFGRRAYDLSVMRIAAATKRLADSKNPHFPLETLARVVERFVDGFVPSIDPNGRVR
jgi:hypothetical protein